MEDKMIRPESLAEKIVRLRRKKRWNVERLSSVSGYTPSHLRSIECGAQSCKGAKKFYKLAQSLDVSVEYLFDDKEEVKEVSATDGLFYQKYLRLDEKTKARVRSTVEAIVKVWGDS